MNFSFYRKKFCSEEKLIERYLKREKNPNISFDIKGNQKTLLDCIVGKTDKNLIDLLISQRDVINDLETYNQAILLYYIDQNNLKEIQNLISQINLDFKYEKNVKKEDIKNIRASTNYVTYFQCEKSSLLNEAIIRNNIEILEILVIYGSNIDEKCLVKKFATDYANNDVDNIDFYNLDEILTPLSKAIRLNNLEIVKYLLENNADLNQEIMPRTLAMAIVRDEYELLKLLMEYGLDSSQETEFTFFRIETRKSDNPLDPNRVYRNIKSEQYHSLLEFAKKRGSPKILGLLLQN